MSEQIFAGLDLGTTKACCVVGARTDQGVDILGYGTVPSGGIKQGEVVNVRVTVESIEEAIHAASHMSGAHIDTVYVSIAGSHVHGVNEHGVTAVVGGEVTEEDVRRALAQARAVPLPSDRRIVHVVPQEYKVDHQEGVREPVGMAGVRLEVRAHLVTVSASAYRNVQRCVEQAGLYLADVVLQPLASAESVLTDDEKEIGVAVVDIGGGTTDLIVYLGGAVVHTCVVPLGGQSVTRDLSMGLRTTFAEADRIKVKHGCCLEELVAEDDTIDVPSVGGRPPRTVSRRLLCDIIEPRVTEIFDAVRHLLEASGYAEQLAAGVVLTGGGARLEGAEQLAERHFGMPVRLGVPFGFGGLGESVRAPQFATATGLLRWAAREGGQGGFEVVPEQTGTWARGERGSFVGRIGAWLREVF